MKLLLTTPLFHSLDAVMYDFRRSEWFERGWTLQELLAPQCVVFVNQNWELIGRKSAPNHACAIEGSSLEKVISEVTSIPQDVLCEFESHRGSIGQAAKWAWAANRRTTKAEDVAYCLLGIFDVHMPLIYGEGEYNARKRLYQEIKKKADEDKDNDFQHPVRPHPSASQSSYEGRADADILSHALAMMKIDRGNVRRSSWPADETSSTSSDVEITTEPQEVIMVATEVPIAPPLQDVQTDDIDEDERCPKCRELLFEPVTTSCKHSFCAACMSHQADDELALIWEPLESGNIQGDAAQENFGRQYSCPVCGAQALLYHNTALAQQLQIKHPRTFAQRSETAHAADDDSGFMSIAIGNWHDLVRADHHRWTFFIKPSRTDIIREVHVNLHESFAEPHKVLRRPPYKLNCRGWGYFTVGVQLILQPGYVWLSKNAEDALDGTPGAALKLQWTLDFASHGGLGSMGRCRVKMQRQNRR